MMEALFILSNDRKVGDDFAKSQPFIGPYRIIINEAEAAACLKPGSSPALVLIIDDPPWIGWQDQLRALRVRSIDLRRLT